MRHLPQALGVVNPEADFQLLLWAFKANTSFSLTVKKSVRIKPKLARMNGESGEDTYVKIISNLFYLSMSGDASIFCEIAEGLVDQRFVNFVPGQYTQHTREGEYRWRKVKEFSLYNKCLWNTKTKHLRV